jgi:hypothetical protein
MNVMNGYTNNKSVYVVINSSLMKFLGKVRVSFIVKQWRKVMTLPMSYSLTDTSFSHNNWLEGEVVDSRPTRCVCKLPIKKWRKLMNS